MDSFSSILLLKGGANFLTLVLRSCVFFFFLTFILLLESYVHSGASACGCTQVAFSVFERAATRGKRNSSPVISFDFNCQIVKYCQLSSGMVNNNFQDMEYFY